MLVRATETSDGRTSGRGSVAARIGPAAASALAGVTSTRAVLPGAASVRAMLTDLASAALTGTPTAEPTPSCDAAQSEDLRVVLAEDDARRDGDDARREDSEASRTGDDAPQADDDDERVGGGRDGSDPPEGRP